MNWLALGLQLLPSIFGLFGGGGGQQEPDVKTISSLTPEQQQVASQLAQLLLGGIGRPLPTYQGELVAPLHPLQQQALDQMGQLMSGPTLAPLPAGGPTPVFAPGLGEMPTLGTSQLRQPLESSLARLLSGAPSTNINERATEEFYKTRVEAPALKTFTEEVLPRIRDEHIATGNFYSRARAQAEARAASDLAAALASERAKLAYADEQARRQLAETAAQRALGAAGTAASYALESQWQPFQAGLAARELAGSEFQQAWTRGMGERQQKVAETESDWRRALDEFSSRMSALQQALQFGGVGQQHAQDVLTAAYQQWEASQPWNSPYLQMALQFLGVPMLAAYQPPQRVSPLAQFLSAVSPIVSGLAQGGFFNKLFNF